MIGLRRLPLLPLVRFAILAAATVAATLAFGGVVPRPPMGASRS